MSAPAPRSQPDKTAVRQEVAALRKVGEIIAELNDCGFERAIEVIDVLTKQRDAAMGALEQIKCVVADNSTVTARHDLALKFVGGIVTGALEGSNDAA